MNKNFAPAAELFKPQRLFKNIADQQLDVLIVGGGINGAVVFAACAMANLKVALVEENDFGSMTSQASSNLIWGGIKYLESFDFKLVNDLCLSRNRLMTNFPDNVQEIRFLATHLRKFRYPLWFLYLGSWVYQLLGRNKTSYPRHFNSRQLYAESSILNRQLFNGAFEYSDAILPENDSRFVLQFIKQGIYHGGSALNYTKFVSAKHTKKGWLANLQDSQNRQFTCQAKVLINAAGPLADATNKSLKQKTGYKHVYSKGVHLIFPRLEQKNRVLAFFADDGRLFFLIPMGNRSCVGTTDTKEKNPTAKITKADRDFLLSNINRLLKLPKPLTTADIIAERCGVRPLAVADDDQKVSGDWFKLSRKHQTTVDAQQKFITIYGGKLTDCLNIGQEVLDVLANSLDLPVKSSNLDLLAEPDHSLKQQFLEQCQKLKIDQLTPAQALEPISHRLWRRYYNEHNRVLQLITDNRQLLQEIAPGTEIYVIDEYMAQHFELAQNAADFWRRRTLGAMTIPKEQLDNIKLQIIKTKS